jgi:hypothetical protein
VCGAVGYLVVRECADIYVNFAVRDVSDEARDRRERTLV